jgi:hypothetical protein
MLKKTPGTDGSPGVAINGYCKLQGNHVLSLWAFLAFSNRELDLLSFFQGFTAFHCNGAEMDENITLAFTRNKTKTFFVVEPLDGSDNCF